MPEPIINLARDAREILPEEAPPRFRPASPDLDEMLFASPRSAESRVFFPRFRIATWGDQDTRRRQRITLDRYAEYILVVFFEPYAAESIADAARQAKPVGDLASITAIELRFGDRLARPFQTIEEVDGLLRATLRISEAHQILFDELIEKTNPTCRIDRSRWPDALKRPWKELRDRLAADLQHFVEHRYDWNGGIPPFIDEPLPSYWQRVSDQIHRELDPQLATLDRPMPPLEVPVRRTDIPQPEPADMNLMRHTIDGHDYFQDLKSAGHFYYLPDYYDLAPKANGVPELLIIRHTNSKNEYQIDYLAFPRVDKQKRLRSAAKGKLQEIAGRAATVTLDPLKLEGAMTMRFSVCMSGTEEKERPDAAKDIHHRISDHVVVNATELKSLYEALFGRSAVLFTGTIHIRIGKSWPYEFDFRGRITGKRDEVWKCVYDGSAPAQFKRPIQTEAAEDCFRDDVQSLIVKIENGGEVTLTRDKRLGRAERIMDIGDFVLDEPDSGVYRYCTIRRRTNGPPIESEWILSTEASLFIEG